MSTAIGGAGGACGRSGRVDRRMGGGAAFSGVIFCIEAIDDLGGGAVGISRPAGGGGVDGLGDRVGNGGADKPPRPSEVEVDADADDPPRLNDGEAAEVVLLGGGGRGATFGLVF